MNRSKYSITATTRVCCSMISDTQMAYGSRVLRHGRSRRFARYQHKRAERNSVGGALIGKIFIGISLILAAEPEVQHSPYAVHLCTLGVEELFYNMRIPFLPVVLLTVCWIGCGGGSSSTTSTTPTPPTPTTPTAPPPPTGTSNAGGNLTTPQVITVANGQATSGINILVPNTASAFNVKLLGVNSLGASTISASNVGGAIARGTSALILIFG